MKSLIICVDDEEIVLNSLKVQLRKIFNNTFEIETTTDPHEAIEILKDALEDEIEVPIIISDYVMPIMKGDKFLEEVSKISKYTRNVMLTGQATIEGVTYAINNANLFRYISKPWEELDLKMTIEGAICSYSSEKEIIDLNSKNEHLYRKMHRTFVSSISALSYAIDARDSYTIGHSKRVTIYSLIIGKLLNFEEEQMENLKYMAILHDVGKIGIRDNILLKEEKLSEEEFINMQRHVTIGADIIKNINGYESILPGVLYHHERYDGKGYENKRMGENIPIEARIICVADSFDAMTSDRPYRKALPKEVAIEELAKYSGVQFDPSIVKIFIDYIENVDLSSIL